MARAVDGSRRDCGDMGVYASAEEEEAMGGLALYSSLSAAAKAIFTILASVSSRVVFWATSEAFGAAGMKLSAYIV